MRKLGRISRALTRRGLLRWEKSRKCFHALQENDERSSTQNRMLILTVCRILDSVVGLKTPLPPLILCRA